MPLYPGAAPMRADWPGLIAGGAKASTSPNGGSIFNVTAPSYTAYLPEPGRNTGTAVLVAPGGGFRMVSINSEGTRVATSLAERGIAAFVVKYRLV